MSLWFYHEQVADLRLRFIDPSVNLVHARWSTLAAITIGFWFYRMFRERTFARVQWSHRDRVVTRARVSRSERPFLRGETHWISPFMVYVRAPAGRWTFYNPGDRERLIRHLQAQGIPHRRLSAWIEPGALGAFLAAALLQLNDDVMLLFCIVALIFAVKKTAPGITTQYPMRWTRTMLALIVAVIAHFTVLDHFEEKSGLAWSAPDREVAMAFRESRRQRSREPLCSLAATSPAQEQVIQNRLHVSVAKLCGTSARMPASVPAPNGEPR